MKEIARSLGIPLFTGYSRLRAARKEFAAAVHRLRSARGEP
jgi:DNA-directed RNA polymerase specialized sigma24 family protein